MVVFKGKVHLGYLAAIIAASNAGGAGSVVGDTTTTLMWIDGVNPLDVLHAFVASFVALAIFGISCRHPAGQVSAELKVMRRKMLKLTGQDRNCFFHPGLRDSYQLGPGFPGSWCMDCHLLGAFVRKTPWGELKNAWMGTVFLMALVTCASLMPVDELPPASMWTAFAFAPELDCHASDVKRTGGWFRDCRET